MYLTFWYSEARQAYAGHPFTKELLHAELHIKDYQGIANYHQIKELSR